MNLFSNVFFNLLSILKFGVKKRNTKVETFATSPKTKAPSEAFSLAFAI